jgi:hypothetical protein
MSHFHYLSNIVPQSKMETITDVAAVSAIASPWWLPYLKFASEEAALLLPPAGLAYIVIKIVAHILVTRKALRDSK